jgi:hypothetical protein
VGTGAGAVVVAGGGSTVVTGAGVVVVGGSCVGAVLAGRAFVVVAFVVVAVVSVVDVVPYAPLYSYCPRQDVHTGSEDAGGNGTSGRLPSAVSMYACQIWAGKVGPETAIPCTFSIGISALG